MKNSAQKNYKLIFLYLAFYGLSVGVWSEFSQLWLNSQNISIANIGLIIAGGSVLTAAIVVVVTKYTKKINEIIILKFIFLIKFIFLLGMVLGYYYHLNWLSVICYLFDSVINNLIVLITYPIITYIIKSESIYSKRKLIEYTATDIGVLISSLLIGKSIGSLNLNYNFMLILSMFFIIGATITVLFINNNDQFKVKRRTNIRKIFKDKIICVYLVYFFIGQIAYYTALGMMLLLLINYADLNASSGSLFIVFCYILGDIFGYLALKKLTPNNDYITILLKFGVRFLMYCLIVILPIKWILLFGISVSLFFSRAYENKTDGLYINRLEKSEIFEFSNIRYAIGFIGKATGTMLCGLIFEFGLRYIFGICLIFLFIQIIMGLYLVKMRKTEQNNIFYIL